MFNYRGSFIKKYKSFLWTNSEWLFYLYSKLNWINKYFKEKYQWCNTIIDVISHNFISFSNSHQKLMTNFKLQNDGSQIQQVFKKATWKWIDTSWTSFDKFSKLKNQLDLESHPLIKIISIFQGFMVDVYQDYWSSESLSNKYDINEMKEQLIDNVQRFIALLLFTTIKFYSLDIKDNQSNIDILTEIITDKVVQGDLYRWVSSIKLAILNNLRDEISNW